MRRKSLGILLGLMILVVSGAVAAEEEVQLSLAQTVELALQEDVNHKIAQVNLDNAKVAYEKSMADNLLNESAYNTRLAEYNLMKAENTYLDSVADVVISAVSQFGDVAAAALDLKIREQELALSKRQLELTRQKVAAQNASELDLLQAESAWATSQFNYQKAKDVLEERRQDFWLLIGQEGVSPDGVLSFVPFDVNLAEVLEEVLSSSVTVKEAEENVALAKLELEEKTLEGAAELLLREAKNNLQLAELMLERTRQDIIRNLTTSYNSVNQAAQNYNLAVQNWELETKKFAITERQVQAGLKTQDDLTSAQIALLESEKAKFSALTSYLVSYLKFEKTARKDLRESAVLQQQGTAE